MKKPVRCIMRPLLDLESGLLIGRKKMKLAQCCKCGSSFPECFVPDDAEDLTCFRCAEGAHNAQKSEQEKFEVSKPDAATTRYRRRKQPSGIAVDRLRDFLESDKL